MRNRARDDARRGTADPTGHQPAALTAHERFKRGQAARTWAGVVAAVGLHVCAVLAFPALTATADAAEGESTRVIELPPEVEVPPPPERVARPAEPRIADVEPATTLPPNVDLQADPPPLPPPPEADAPAERPEWIRRDVDPEAVNDGEIRRLLKSRYPPGLRDAGIEGRVTLWLFVDTGGGVTKVRLREPSPYDAFNRVAREVAREMEFRPARLRGEPVGVWVRRSLIFRTRR